MDFLKPEFDIEIDSTGAFTVLGVEYLPSEILKGIALPKYEDGFTDWLISRRQTMLDRVDDINAQFNQVDRFNKLKLACVGRKITPFVGAGLSIPSGYPGWTTFLWSVQSNSSVSDVDLKAMLDAGDYEQAAQALYDDLGAALFNERLQTTFDKPCTPSGAINYLPYLASGNVVTTNFDTLLETTFRQPDQGFDHVLLGNALFEAPRLTANGTRVLVKIHGTCQQISNRVVLAKEYEEAYRDDGNVRRFFEGFLFGSSLLFVGCSLSVDRTIKEMCRVVNDIGASGLPRHYAILELADPPKRQERERALANANIFPIWYPAGEHQNSVEPILSALLEGS